MNCKDRDIKMSFGKKFVCDIVKYITTCKVPTSIICFVRVSTRPSPHSMKMVNPVQNLWPLLIIGKNKTSF